MKGFMAVGLNNTKSDIIVLAIDFDSKEACLKKAQLVLCKKHCDVPIHVIHFGGEYLEEGCAFYAYAIKEGADVEAVLKFSVGIAEAMLTEDYSNQMDLDAVNQRR